MSNVASNKLGNNGGRSYSFLNRPVWIDCNFVVDATNGNGLGIRSLKGSGVQQVFMHTSSTPAGGNPNPASGYALIQLANNYNRYCGGFSGYISPVTGGALNIDANSAALTVGQPYIITSVGHAAAGQASIVAVADSAGSLASTWFSLYDGYGNTYIVWFYVTGVGGGPPAGVSGTPVQVTIASGAANTAVAAAMTSVLGLLAPPQVAGVFSFTTSTSGHTTLATNTSTNPYHLPGPPAEGLIPTGFTFSLSVNDRNSVDWRGVGLPKGVTAAVGASFVATATGFGSSTGQVKLPGSSGVNSIEVIGDPNASIGPVPLGGSPNVGGWIMVQFLKGSTSAVTSALTMNSYTPAGTNNSATPPIFTGTPAVLTGTIVNSGGATTFAPGAPADGTVVGLGFYVEAGSILIQGE